MKRLQKLLLIVGRHAREKLKNRKTVVFILLLCGRGTNFNCTFIILGWQRMSGIFEIMGVAVGSDEESKKIANELANMFIIQIIH